MRGKSLFIVLCLGIEFVEGGTSADLRQFVLESIRHNESLVKNFETEFTVRWYDPDGKPLQGSGKEEFITEERWSYARQGNKIYAHFGRDWSDRHSESGTQVYDGNRMLMHRADLSSGMIQARKQFPTSAVPDRFTNLYRNVGDLSMSEFLEASTIKAVTPCRGRGIRGFLVEVVHKDSSPSDPLEQKIYFDADKGFVPAIVETYLLNLSRDQPVLVDEVTEFEQVTSEIYFPRKARLVSYWTQQTADSNEPRLVKDHEVRTEVSRLRVNVDLPEDMFRMNFPQGTRVYDETLDLAYQVGVTGKHLAEIDMIAKTEFRRASGGVAGTSVGPPLGNDATDAGDRGSGHGRDRLGAGDSETTQPAIVFLSPDTSSLLTFWSAVLLVAALVAAGGLVLQRQLRKRG